MSHYFFVKDLKDGQAAEKVIEDYLLDLHPGCRVEKLPRDRQIEGDLECIVNDNDRFTVEVKFDKMAQKTGNLCFEMANGKGKPTGIATTKADTVVYMVPKTDSSVELYWFNTISLRYYLADSANISKIRCVNGGDKKAFALLLVSTENVVLDGISKEPEIINAELPV